MKNRTRCISVFSLWLMAAVAAVAQGDTFTYQGRLTIGSNGYTGVAEFQATLWNASSGGTVVASNSPAAVVADVNDGLFAIPLNFGAAFSGADRWLQLEVRTNQASFTTLSPRQQIRPAPYAITAGSLTGQLPATQLAGTVDSANLSGTYSGALTLNNPANSFTGSGAGLTGLNASNLASGIVPDLRLAGNVARTNQVWLLGGNGGTTAGTNFLGTTDNQPLELKANGIRALRLQPVTNDIGRSNIINVVAGSPVNFVPATTAGATIAGGGAFRYVGLAWSNRVDADFGAISGGARNLIQANSFGANIGGGTQNTIQTNVDHATIGGGENNTIQSNALDATISGGSANSIQLLAYHSTIGGGSSHTIQTNCAASTIAGGYDNTIRTEADYATIGGGQINVIEPSCDSATVGGGEGNRIGANGRYATIPGGANNVAAGLASFAAGYRAKANHSGTFVWADFTPEDFASTGNNQFSVRARGGVRLSDDTPNLSFGSQTRQMLRLYDTTYGIGVQSSCLYQRSNADFSWFQDGVHSDTRNDPGAGGTELMRLRSSGLTVNGTFVSSSDRNAKENIVAVEPRTILEKVAGLPIAQWNYKHDKQTPHVGPMAQDFHAAFGVGPDDKHIATVDADGVALAAIQGLNQKTDSEIASLRAENSRLLRRLEKLEQLVNQLKIAE